MNPPILMRAMLSTSVLLLMVHGACTPDSGITAAESDVVITNYDKDFNFSAPTTFAVLDTIVHLTGDSTKVDDPNLSRDFDEFILQKLRDKFAERGYTEEQNPVANPPDISIYVAAASTEFFNVYSGYPWYPCSPWYGCGGWWWWYPPPVGGVSYAYTTGTLIVNWIAEATADDYLALVPWNGALNGVLDDTKANKATRIDRGLDQMFDQSPYVRKP